MTMPVPGTPPTKLPRVYHPTYIRFVAAEAGESLLPKLDLGTTEFSGLAGTTKPRVTFSQFISVGEEPDVLAFLRKHDVVDITYTTEETGWGGKDRTLTARSCRLEDVTLVEVTGGVALQYVLRAERMEGDLLGGGA